VAAYAGRKGLVYLSTTGSNSASSVIKLSKWSINRTTDKIDVTSFGDANKTYVQGLPDVKGSFEGAWDDTETKVFTAAASASGCIMYLYPSSDAITKYFYGPAWLDASMDCGVSAAVTISGSYAANGSWGQTV